MSGTHTRRATVAKASRDSRKGVAKASRDSRKGVARTSQRHRANVANLSQRVARMSQSRRATVAKASRDIPAMPFSATILFEFSAKRTMLKLRMPNKILTTSMYANGVSFYRGLCLVSESSDREVRRSQC